MVVNADVSAKRKMPCMLLRVSHHLKGEFHIFQSLRHRVVIVFDLLIKASGCELHHHVDAGSNLCALLRDTVKVHHIRMIQLAEDGDLL